MGNCICLRPCFDKTVTKKHITLLSNVSSIEYCLKNSNDFFIVMLVGTLLLGAVRQMEVS